MGGLFKSPPTNQGGAPLESSFDQGSLLPFSPVGESAKTHKLNHRLPPHPRGLPRGIRRNLKIKFFNLIKNTLILLGVFLNLNLFSTAYQLQATS